MSTATTLPARLSGPPPRPVTAPLTWRRLAAPAGAVAGVLATVAAVAETWASVVSGRVAEGPTGALVALLAVLLLGAAAARHGRSHGLLRDGRAGPRGGCGPTCSTRRSPSRCPCSTSRASGSCSTGSTTTPARSRRCCGAPGWQTGRALLRSVLAWVVAGLTWAPAWAAFPRARRGLVLAAGLAARPGRVGRASSPRRRPGPSSAAQLEEAVAGRDDVRSSLGQPHVVRQYAERSAAVLRRVRRDRHGLDRPHRCAPAWCCTALLAGAGRRSAWLLVGAAVARGRRAGHAVAAGDLVRRPAHPGGPAPARGAGRARCAGPDPQPARRRPEPAGGAPAAGRAARGRGPRPHVPLPAAGSRCARCRLTVPGRDHLRAGRAQRRRQVDRRAAALARGRARAGHGPARRAGRHGHRAARTCGARSAWSASAPRSWRRRSRRTSRCSPTCPRAQVERAVDALGLTAWVASLPRRARHRARRPAARPCRPARSSSSRSPGCSCATSSRRARRGDRPDGPADRAGGHRGRASACCGAAPASSSRTGCRPPGGATTSRCSTPGRLVQHGPRAELAAEPGPVPRPARGRRRRPAATVGRPPADRPSPCRGRREGRGDRARPTGAPAVPGPHRRAAAAGPPAVGPDRRGSASSAGPCSGRTAWSPACCGAGWSPPCRPAARPWPTAAALAVALLLAPLAVALAFRTYPLWWSTVTLQLRLAVLRGQTGQRRLARARPPARSPPAPSTPTGWSSTPTAGSTSSPGRSAVARDRRGRRQPARAARWPAGCWCCRPRSRRPARRSPARRRARPATRAPSSAGRWSRCSTRPAPSSSPRRRRPCRRTWSRSTRAASRRPCARTGCARCSTACPGCSSRPASSRRGRPTWPGIWGLATALLVTTAVSGFGWFGQVAGRRHHRGAGGPALARGGLPSSPAPPTSSRCRPGSTWCRAAPRRRRTAGRVPLRRLVLEGFTAVHDDGTVGRRTTST